MHELSIAMNILDIVEEHISSEESPGIVNRILLHVGEFSGVMEDALEFNFEVAKKGTVADQAKLEIETIESKGSCGECRNEFRVQAFVPACPVCGSYNVEITAGRELQIKEIYLEDE